MSLAPQPNSTRALSVLTGSTVSPAAAAGGGGCKESQSLQHSSGRNAIIVKVTVMDVGECGLLLLDVTMKKGGKRSPPACKASSHRTLTTVNVSVCGRTVLSAAALQVQTFCCSWWQTLIMCSTKQELGLHGRVAV